MGSLRRMTVMTGMLLLGAISASCAFHGDGMASADQILLGAKDVITVPKTSSRLDDFTCGSRVLICEDYGSALRCRCSQTGTVKIP